MSLEVILTCNLKVYHVRNTFLACFLFYLCRMSFLGNFKVEIPVQESTKKFHVQNLRGKELFCLCHNYLPCQRNKLSIGHSKLFMNSGKKDQELLMSKIYQRLGRCHRENFLNQPCYIWKSKLTFSTLYAKLSICISLFVIMSLKVA